MRVGSVEQAQHHGGEIDIGVVLACAIGKPVEQRRQLIRHVGGEGSEAAPELRAAQRRDADLLEEHAPIAVGGHLEKEEIERAREGALRIEDIQLRLERVTRVRDDLVDRRDEQIFLRREVVMDQSRGESRVGGDALHRRAGEAVLHDRGAQPVDDLAATRLGEARTTHRVDWLADQPINVNAKSGRGRARDARRVVTHFT